MSYQLIQGSAHHLPMLPDKSVHALVTSPPYYGLRAYEGDQAIEWRTVEYAPMAGLAPIRVQGCEPGCQHEWGTYQVAPKHNDDGITGSTLGGGKATQAQAQRQPIQGAYCIHCDGWRGGLGLEPTIEMYIGHLILCLREWHRVLRDDGIAWVNLGDSYNGSGGAGGDYNPGGSKEGQPKYPGRRINGLKPKDLCMIPARFALAAQADGWYLRSAIVWAKGVSFIPHYAGSCMPDSTLDRPSQSYEMVYMLSKKQRYYFDMEAVKEPAAKGSAGSTFTSGKTGINGLGRVSQKERQDDPNRHIRSVWAISPRGYKEAHFATWPEALVTPMIKASTSAHGVCAQCGAPWKRIVEKERVSDESLSNGNKAQSPNVFARGGNQANFGRAGDYESQTIGWQPTCQCACDEVIPATVIDPFNGSGTSGRAALKLGRSYIGVDISSEYLEDLSPKRMSNVQMELAL